MFNILYFQVSKEEIDHLRSNMKSMDREKDMLQTAVDEKTERVAQLNSQIHDRVSPLSAFDGFLS